MPEWIVPSAEWQVLPSKSRSIQNDLESLTGGNRPKEADRDLKS